MRAHKNSVIRKPSYFVGGGAKRPESSDEDSGEHEQANDAEDFGGVLLYGLECACHGKNLKSWIHLMLGYSTIAIEVLR